MASLSSSAADGDTAADTDPQHLGNNILELLTKISNGIRSQQQDVPLYINQLELLLPTVKSLYPEKNQARADFLAALLRAIPSTVPPLPQELQLDVAWDLDDCLIKSQRLSKELEPDTSLNTTVTHRISTHEIVHVDDDQMIFRTVLRSFTHLILALLQPLCRHHVFTSASRGYMTNVVSLVEHVLGPNTFQPKRLSCTDFPRHHLTHGKDISNLDIPKYSQGCILVDDNARYHQTQPMHGIQIGVFSSINEDCDDALFEVACNVLRAAAAAGGGGGGGVAGSPLTKVCIAANKEKYWEDLVLARAFALSRDHVYSGGLVDEVDAVLANDAWGSAAIGDVLHLPALERVGEARRKRFIKGFHHWTKYFNGTKL